MQMLVARAKEQRRIASKMPAGGTVAARRHKDFGMSSFKGSCRDCTFFPARLKAAPCPQWTCDVFSASWATSSATEFHLRNLPRIAHDSGRDGWLVAATAWPGAPPISPMRNAGVIRGRRPEHQLGKLSDLFQRFHKIDHLHGIELNRCAVMPVASSGNPRGK
jgi:hypothetical protein